MLTLSAVASAALAAPHSSSARLRRDVSELLQDANAVDLVPPVTEYLPIDAADGATELPESAALGEQGYEYRTVRRLKLRHRRDVSHLPANQYLPPPSNRYLPPAAVPTPAAAPAPASDDTEEVVSAVEPKLAREYLPPVEEAATTEAPSAVDTEAPAVAEEVKEEEQPLEADVRVVDVPTGVLQADGYHYKQPAEQPVELKEAAKEYLPPLGGDVIAEGPADGESAALTKDGYQYRAIRRYRF